ncbi:chorismate mutase [Ascosphaera apis ARSEF 7405]|uniref:Chorismate mutase n=1 Tax=Ascosphaera apis ARSEF 7405 TaxID=392613 RepID=A0A166PET2_9EURO|nr:chorismate mutase [Ascosphaera apis ARSEF 7405]
MDTAIEAGNASQPLDLSTIRFQLVRLEDTIIFHLIERVQFPLNEAIYQPGGVKIPDSDLSLMDWLLFQRERLDSMLRRYESPDEYPFFPEALKKPILAPINYPKVLHTNDITINPTIKERYIKEILPAICRHDRESRGEAEENYGSSATADVAVLQSLSRRIHYGAFVAEAKFRKDPETFVRLIKSNDTKGIDEAITDSVQEEKVLKRLRLKAQTYGQDLDEPHSNSSKINVDAVVNMYKNIVIPLTKELEVDYLMKRLNGTKWE